MAEEGVKRKVLLSDGTSCEVGERQSEAISELTKAIDFVARGVAENLSIVMSDGAGNARQRLFSMTERGAGLDVVANALVHQSKIARQVASAWDGNVRAEARSYMEH